MSKLSSYIYRKVLPIYIPKYGRYQLAMWDCGSHHGEISLWDILRKLRITIRKDGFKILTIKKGEI